MNLSHVKIFVLSTILVSTIHADFTDYADYSDFGDLVKTCKNFKKSFLEACHRIDENEYTNEIEFLKENLTMGSSIIFYGVIIKAIDDSIRLLSISLLSRETDPRIEEIISDLRSFKSQLNSDFFYDLNTGVAVKKELTRAGTTRMVSVPYDGTRCYKVAHNMNKQK